MLTVCALNTEPSVYLFVFSIQLRMSTPWLSRPEKPEEMGEKIKLARRFHENITCLTLKKYTFVLFKPYK